MGWEACQTVEGKKNKCHFNRRDGETYCVDEKRSEEVCRNFETEPTLEEASKSLMDEVAEVKGKFNSITHISPPVISKPFSWGNFLRKAFQVGYVKNHIIYERRALP